MRPPSRMGGRLFFALVGLWVGFGLSAPAQAQTDTVDPELAKLRSEIAASRSRVVSHEREERDLVQLLEDVDRGLDALDGQVGASEEALSKAENRVSSADEKLRVLEFRMVETRRVMSQRAVALYKAGAEGPLRLLFASQDLREMFSKLWNLERILQADAALLEQFRSQWLELEDLHNQAT